MGLPLSVDVECYAGYRSEETPRRFGLAGAAIEVAEVVDCWLAPDHRYFKVRDSDGDVYILRNDIASGGWELISFRRHPNGAEPSPVCQSTRIGTPKSAIVGFTSRSKS
jgi:hypothetical protein